MIFTIIVITCHGQNRPSVDECSTVLKLVDWDRIGWSPGGVRLHRAPYSANDQTNVSITKNHLSYRYNHHPWPSTIISIQSKMIFSFGENGCIIVWPWPCPWPSSSCGHHHHHHHIFPRQEWRRYRSASYLSSCPTTKDALPLHQHHQHHHHHHHDNITIITITNIIGIILIMTICVQENNNIGLLWKPFGRT